jgi:hypothetical protein
MALFSSLLHPSHTAILPRRHSWGPRLRPVAPLTPSQRSCIKAPAPRGPAASSASSSTSSREAAEWLLDGFWKARGVTDADLRRWDPEAQRARQQGMPDRQWRQQRLNSSNSLQPARASSLSTLRVPAELSCALHMRTGRHLETQILIGCCRRLVAAAKGVEDEASAYELNSEEPLPGIHAAWFFENAAASTLPQVRQGVLQRAPSCIFLW